MVQTVFGAQGKVAAAFGRLRPAVAGCVKVGACIELVADVDLEIDARYEWATAVDLEVVHTKCRVGLIKSSGTYYMNAMVQALAHAVFGAQGKVATAFGRLRPVEAGCVKVGAYIELVADVDLE
ncbi:hypothetical protein M885DRAFT_580760, partial [Pelagophyceae sp. CCMP2097]